MELPQLPGVLDQMAQVAAGAVQLHLELIPAHRAGSAAMVLNILLRLAELLVAVVGAVALDQPSQAIAP
jgi:hypothetical protein